MYLKTFYIFFLIFLVSSCYKGEEVDLIVHNAQIHTMNNGKIVQAMAIKNGKIIELGANRQILNKYRSKKEIDAKGKEIYPGFTDSHGHILSYIEKKLSVDLTGTKSYLEMINKIKKHLKKDYPKIIIGKGWDQSLWKNKELPNNKILNQHFPEIPVCLYRIDEHAVLVNNAMLELLKLDTIKEIQGGEIVKQNNKPTGILIDNAIPLLEKHLPKHSKIERIEAIKEIENELLSYGITGVHEAGISYEDLIFFQSLVNDNILSLNIYAMLLPEPKNIDFAKKNGAYKNKNLSVRSFKVFGDGSLGSGGALLKKRYTDDIGNHGQMLTSIKKIKELSMICESTGYQLNTHAIGDSMCNIIIDVYKELNEVNKDHRSRIEHVQVIDKNDLFKLGLYGIYPSIQPSHAVSDYRWAEKKLGKKRIKNAYAYKNILESAGIITIGTDFPIESPNPFKTIYAAVKRKNTNELPSKGFIKDQAISLNDCIKGITIWAAISSFNEKSLGSLEEGKDATFTILEKPIVVSDKFIDNQSWKTFILGIEKYSSESL